MLRDMLHSLTMALDPVRFARESLGFQPGVLQQEALRSTSKRVVYNLHRQWGKGVISAILALHRAIYYPKSLILLFSPTLRQSIELFKKVAEFTVLARHAPRRIEDSKMYMTLQNGSRIVSLPGDPETTRGYSAVDLIIIDEASRCDDELYLSVRPMLAMSGGSLLLMSTPQGKRGFYFGIWENGGEAWERYSMKAEDNPRMNPAFLEEERQALGPAFYAQEYCCEFISAEGQLFGLEDIRSAFSQDISPFTKPVVTSDVEAFSARY